MPHTLADYIGAKIRQPRSFGNALKMPQYTLAPQQIDALETALLAQTQRAQSLARLSSYRGNPHLPIIGQPAEPVSSSTTCDCFSCHKIDGRGGDMAPELTWEGSSVQACLAGDLLKNPNTLRPALIRRMPKFNVTDAEPTH